MRKLVLLLAAVVLVSVSAAAQQTQLVTLTDPAAPSPAAPQMGGPDRYPWQIAAGYQFNRDHLPSGPWSKSGIAFNTSGYNFSVARYFGSMLGAEAQVDSGFGNTGNKTFPQNLVAKSVFLGGGARLALRTESRFEPWVHGLVGLAHYRFTQTAPTIGLGSHNSFGYEIGGGADFHFSPNLALRGEVDALGTHLFNKNQSNLQIVVGIAINF
jgi:opacity protein-like surface antigen